MILEFQRTTYWFFCEGFPPSWVWIVNLLPAWKFGFWIYSSLRWPQPPLPPADARVLIVLFKPSQVNVVYDIYHHRYVYVLMISFVVSLINNKDQILWQGMYFKTVICWQFELVGWNQETYTGIHQRVNRRDLKPRHYSDIGDSKQHHNDHYTVPRSKQRLNKPTNLNRKQAAKMDVQMFHHFIFVQHMEEYEWIYGHSHFKSLEFLLAALTRTCDEKTFLRLLKLQLPPDVEAENPEGTVITATRLEVLVVGRWSPQPQVPLSPRKT